MTENKGEITQLLNEAYDGREGALDEVTEAVYTELRRVAERQIRKHDRRDPAVVTLEPSALVNEAFLKLIKQRKRFDSRGHFFAIATKSMLRVLMDHARSKSRRKRGGDLQRVTLTGVERLVGRGPAIDVIDIARVLKRLEGVDERSAEVAKLRLIWGCKVPECAEILDTSVSTVEREWGFARRWLAAELRTGSAPN